MAARRIRYKARGTEQPDRYQFGLRLYELREERGITQAELSAKVGLSHAAVGHWESGRFIPSLVAAKRLADALEISLDELTKGIV